MIFFTKREAVSLRHIYITHKYLQGKLASTNYDIPEPIFICEIFVAQRDLPKFLEKTKYRLSADLRSKNCRRIFLPFFKFYWPSEGVTSKWFSFRFICENFHLREKFLCSFYTVLWTSPAWGTFPREYPLTFAIAAPKATVEQIFNQ